MKTLKVTLLTLLIAYIMVLSVSADEIRNSISVVTSPSDDYIEICGWEFDVEGGGYNISKIDLNGDGLIDEMFSNRATSGTGGQAVTIYLNRKDGKFTRIGTIGHGALRTETILTGEKLLHCSWNLGGEHSTITTYLISHDGLKQYRRLFDLYFC